MATFDDTAARKLLRVYDTDEIVEQRRHTRERLGARLGDHVLDVGCGPGHLVTELADEVGTSGHVAALDPSEPMLDIAREQVRRREVADRVSLTAGDVGGLPFDDDILDGATVVQVLEHVPDVDGALTELFRVLRVGGRLVVVDTDWRSCVWHTADRDRTDRVLRAWESHYAHPDLPVRLPALLEAAGFRDITVEVLPILNVRQDRDSYSLGMLGAITDHAADTERLGPEQAAAWRADVRARVEDGTAFFSLCRYLFRAVR